MLEHSLHFALGYVWLFWVFFNTFGFGEALDDAKTQIRLVKAKQVRGVVLIKQLAQSSRVHYQSAARFPA